MNKKNAGGKKTGGARGRRAPPEAPSPAAGMFDVQRQLWKTGLTDSLQGGLKKLEAVFDERVHDALRRIGIPTQQELLELRTRIAELEQAVRRLSPRRARK
jgi:poly(hydroxyalkanoate) granule-associated protein